MILLTINTPAVYGTGDLHGCFGELINFIKIKDITDCTFVVNGDIGLGFDRLASDNFNFKSMDMLGEERNIDFVLFRGNHDDPDRFENADQYYKGLKRVHILQDYTVVTFVNEEGERHNMLAVGGATSVDRFLRINQMRKDALKLAHFHRPTMTVDEAIKNVRQLYWPDELPTFVEGFFDDLAKSGIKIDTVATHTAPSFCFPRDKNGLEMFLQEDKALEADLNAERDVMDRIYNRLKEDGHPIRKWMYGHYHNSHNEEIDGTVFTLVDMVRNAKVDTCRIF